MKRLTAIVLASAMLLPTLFGCASSKTEEKTETKTETTKTETTEKTEEATKWQPEDDFTIRVSAAAGGILDNIGRVFGQAMSETYGVNSMVTNILGANAVVCGADLMSTEPSPNELMIGNVAMMSTAPAFFPNESLDLEDFEYIGSLLCEDQFMFACPKNTGIETFDDMVAYGKENGIVLGSQAPGNGVLAIATKIFAELGIEVTNVYSEGTNLDMVALVAGDVDISMGYASTGLQFFREGEVVPVASFGDVQSTAFEGLEVPTVQEKGVDVVFKANNFIFALKGTDPEVLAQMYDKYNEWLETDAAKELCASIDYVPFQQDPEDLKQELRDAKVLFQDIYDNYY